MSDVKRLLNDQRIKLTGMSEDVLQSIITDNWTSLYTINPINATVVSSAITPTTSTASYVPVNNADYVQEVTLAVILCVVIVVTVIGNTLVIIAVLTTRRLRTVTNCFVMSLAVADWLVGVSVMPPAVAYRLMGVWKLGWLLCDIWISLDVLLCTASILSLCAISVDRYLAVTQPLSYSRKRRSKRLALTMIMIVWLSSALITCPPIFGWYDKNRNDHDTTCAYNKNEGYVIFSAMGSFFIPMVVMLYVYLRISCVVAQRHDQLAHIEDHSSTRRTTKSDVTNRDGESDMEAGSSECEEQIRCTRYHGSVCACITSDQPLRPQSSPNQESRKNGTGGGSGSTSRSTMRSSLNYSFRGSVHSAGEHHHHTTPQRTVSLYCTTNLSTKSKTDTGNVNHLDVPVLHFEPTTHRVSSFRRETKTAQTLSIVVGGFIACWLPFFVYYLLTPFLYRNQHMDNDTVNKSHSLIMAYLTWLGWINSAINPFIYAFYSPDFRIAFWRLTLRHCTQNRRADIGGGGGGGTTAGGFNH